MNDNLITSEKLERLGQDPGIGDFIHGLRLCVSEAMVVQYRFPRSKKRRIRKKWAKRPCNFLPRQECFLMEQQGVIIMHPMVAAKFRAIVNQAGFQRVTYSARYASSGATARAFSFYP